MKQLMITSLAVVVVSSAALAASNYNLNWYSVSSGGDNAATSASYSLVLTSGQVAGEADSPSFKMGLGFTYGVQVCQCSFQSDFDDDGFLTALDLSKCIDILFAGSPDVQDADCPNPRADFDCDGFSTALDLSGLIDHLFAGGDGPCEPCSP